MIIHYLWETLTLPNNLQVIGLPKRNVPDSSDNGHLHISVPTLGSMAI